MVTPKYEDLGVINVDWHDPKPMFGTTNELSFTQSASIDID